MKKQISILSLFIILLLCINAYAQNKTKNEFKLIWRESWNMPIEKVDTPKGFNITPAEAINPLMARSSRVSWSDFYLFIDNIKAL